MKKILLLNIFILISIISNAQRSNLEKRIKAHTIEDYILLRYDPNSEIMSFETDPNKQNLSKQHTLKNDDITEFAAKKDKINIDLAFLNPLKYDISIGINYKEDEIYKNLRTFATSLNALVSTTTGLSSKIKIIGIDTSALKNSEGKLIGNIVLKKNTVFRTSASWYAWYFQVKKFYFDDNTGKIRSKEDSSNVEILNTLFINTGNIYNKLSGSNKDKMIDEIINDYAQIKEINKYEELTNGIKKINKKIEDYSKMLNNISSELPKLKSNFRENFKNTKDGDLRIYDYTDVVINEYNMQISNQIETEEQIINSIKSILGGLTNLLNTKYDKELDALILREMDIKPELTAALTIKIGYEDEGKIKNPYFELHVSEYSIITTEFSIGTAFTNISYQVYGLETASNGFKITSTDGGVNNFAYLGMINLIPNISSNVFPIIQIGTGLTTGANRTLPAVALGGGFRFFHPAAFSITFGSIWNWSKKLDGINVGDLITSSAELEKNSTTTFNPVGNFYIGIQYNFGN